MKNLKIHFLNTIWSDAIILESNNHFAFVDTGSTFYYPMIEKHLQDLNVRQIDFIILTHFHSDHYGNVKSIIDNYNVQTIYLKHYYGLDGSTASGYASNEEYIEHEFQKYNEIIDSAKNNNTSIVYIDDFNQNTMNVMLDDIKLELYDIKNRLYELYTNPASEFFQKKIFNENFNSIGIFIKIYNNNIFLGGDITCSSTNTEELHDLSIKMIKEIYNKHNINHIDLYKSCHHGGGGTNTLELCELLNAKNVVITNTARWLDQYDTYANLHKANPNVNILTTDYNKYIFNIDKAITYKVIKEDSLFITLNKN